MNLCACVFSVFLCGDDSVMSLPLRHQRHTTGHLPSDLKYKCVKKGVCGGEHGIQTLIISLVVEACQHIMFSFIPLLSSASG